MPDSLELNNSLVEYIEIRCAIGFAIRPKNAVPSHSECGHANCYPSACARLKKLKELGIQFCPDLSK